MSLMLEREVDSGARLPVVRYDEAMCQRMCKECLRCKKRVYPAIGVVR